VRDYISYAVCLGMWAAFGCVLVSRPAALARAWRAVRDLPLPVEALAWIVFLPWLSGLAIWESGWRGAQARRLAVLGVAMAFIAFWSILTFGPQ
jgi:hypothetical protein